ncbi:MAG: hypothetical protein SPJ70_00745 [Candidatus Borkfalkiaceae bacterium]|nr:hypothetical protein [Christensenellaceae bacterium]
MKDFSEFTPQEKKETNGSGDINSQFMKFASAYEGKSADEVMSAILAEAENGKKNGTLTDADVDKFASTVSPFLTDKQRKMLNVIVKKIKG